MIDSSDQLQEFEELFKKKKFKVEDITYQAWLMYKWDSIGSEKEAFEHVLKKRRPSNLSLPTKKRHRVVPEGSAQYNMNDPKWTPIFMERKEKEKKRSTGKKARSKQGAASSVTPDSLESVTLAPSLSMSTFTEPVSNSKSRSRPASKRVTASCTVTSEAADADQDLPDIPEPSVLNSLLEISAGSKKRKRSNNNISSKSTRTEIIAKVTSTTKKNIPSVPKFPLENGLVPLIDDNYEDIFDISNNNTEAEVKVVSKTKTFLDLDFDLDLDTNQKDVNVLSDAQPVSQSIENENNIRASRRLRPKDSTPLKSKSASTSPPPVSKVTSDPDPTSLSNITSNNNALKGRSIKPAAIQKLTSAPTPKTAKVSQSSVSITVIEDGDEIKDQSKNLEVIQTRELEATKYAKQRTKTDKRGAKKKR